MAFASVFLPRTAPHLSEAWKVLQENQHDLNIVQGSLSKDTLTIKFSIDSNGEQVDCVYYMPGLMTGTAKSWKQSSKALVPIIESIYEACLEEAVGIRTYIGSKQFSFGVYDSPEPQLLDEAMLQSYKDFIEKAIEKVRKTPTLYSLRPSKKKPKLQSFKDVMVKATGRMKKTRLDNEDVLEQYQLATEVYRRLRQAKISLELFDADIKKLDAQELNRALSQVDFTMTFAEVRMDLVHFRIENDVRTFEKTIQYLLVFLTFVGSVSTVVLIALTWLLLSLPR